jgi:hypothetical protein
MENIKKLSLSEFKAKAEKSVDKNLSNITGGILGACHCVTWSSVYYNGNTVYSNVYVDCNYYTTDK